MENELYRKIIEGIVDVVTQGQDIKEIKKDVIEILSDWIKNLNEAVLKLEKTVI